MTKFALPLACAVITIGCGTQTSDLPRPALPLFPLVVPKSDDPLIAQFAEGFQLEAKEQGTSAKIATYEKATEAQIVAAARSLNPSTTMPVCVLFTERGQIGDAVQALLNANIRAIAVGADDTNVPRVGHVGFSPADCAMRWNEIRKVAHPKAKKALVVFGENSLKRERLEGAFYGATLNVNTEDYKKSTSDLLYRVRSVGDVKAEDVAWAEFVTAVGESALRKCQELGAQNLIVVDSSEASFEWAQGGVNRYLIAPNFRELGRKALRMAQERYTTYTLTNSILELEYDDSKSTALEIIREAQKTGIRVKEQ